MSEPLVLASSLALGLVLGIIYFGGLWLTLKHMSSCGQPALLVLGSFVVRSGTCLFGFYIMAVNGLDALAICLAGFVIAKVAAVHRFQPYSNVRRAGWRRG